MAAELRLHHRYPLRRGCSLAPPLRSSETAAAPPTQLVTLQFKFKPASVDTSRIGELLLEAAGGARASFAPEGEAEGAAVQSQHFRGVSSGEGGEFVLLAEGQGEELGFRLERVTTSVCSLLHERGADFEGREAMRPPKKSRAIVLPTQRRPRQTGRIKKVRSIGPSTGENADGELN